MKFLVPTGIGDITWALTKVQSIARRLGDCAIDIAIACHNESIVETRALEYVQRFPFVDSAGMLACGPCVSERITDDDGYYDYFPDGLWKDRFALMPNRALEHGQRLETWFADDPIDWAITRSWPTTEAEAMFAADVRESLGPFGVLYFGPESGNTVEGHNRGALWTPTDWAELVLQFRGLPLVAVGADYDLSYYRNHIIPVFRTADPSLRLVYNMIGQTSIGQVLALIRQSAFGVYYQCGLGVWSAFEGIPTAMFWRPEGDSIHPGRMIRIGGEMKTAWVPPAELTSGRYLPAVYGRTGVDEIAAWARGFCS